MVNYKKGASPKKINRLILNFMIWFSQKEKALNDLKTDGSGLRFISETLIFVEVVLIEKFEVRCSIFCAEKFGEILFRNHERS